MSEIFLIAFFSISLLTSFFSQSSDLRPRAREIGLHIGLFKPGTMNAITDVSGVKVGQVTLIEGDWVRTGVTAIIQHEGNLFKEKVPAAIYVGNGFGKLVGFTQMEELGQIETPIVLTNTLSVWEAANTIVQFMLALPGNESVRSLNPVVGETNDGTLNDIRGMYVKQEHVLKALHDAKSGPVDEGSVGAGTGTICFGFKGGIGTSSRVLPPNLSGFTIGVLVQTNFGGILQIDGIPVGKELGKYYLKDEIQYDMGGSCMIVVATDAPLDARQLKRLAKRAILALGRTGSPMSHGSGDYVIAFSTAKEVRVFSDSIHSRTQHLLSDEALSPLFQAVVETTEEAIYNSLLKATMMTGNGHTIEALPIEKIKEILRKYGRIE